MSFSGKTALTNAAPVINDGFWPDLSLADLMNNYRIPPEYADGVIKTGLTLAIIKINKQLFDVKAALIMLGHASLADYTTANSEQINGTEVLITHYTHAVYTRAKADLLQQFNSLNRKPVAENDALESDEMQQHWLDQSQASINEFFKQFLPDAPVFNKAGTHMALI